MTATRGWVIHRYDRVASTMTTAAHLASFGAPDRTAVIAAEQTAGRGRGGRVWQAAARSALFCTLLLRPRLAADRLSTLPLLTGVAVAEAIEQLTGCPAQVKWPNDVWLGADRERPKVAGILTTSHLDAGDVDHVLVGVGINVSTPPESLPPGATSILAATAVTFSVDTIFDAFRARFDDAYGAFLSTNGRPSLAPWRARAALLGETVTIQDSDRAYHGVFTGIDDDGGLLLAEDGQPLRKLVAGDLTRGPRPVT